MASRSVVRSRRVSGIAIALLALGTLPVAGVWCHEQLLTTADAQLRMQELALARGDISSGSPVVSADAASPPRLLLSDALYRTRAMQFGGKPGQGAALAAYGHEVDRAIDARPHWGQAWVIRAYIESLQSGPQHRQTALMALSRSYADAPFLRDAASWRVRFALGKWDELDAFVRRRAIQEAIWLVRVDHDTRKAIFMAARDTGAYQPLILGWRDMRVGDGDYFAPGVASPPLRP